MKPREAVAWILVAALGILIAWNAFRSDEEVSRRADATVSTNTESRTGLQRIPLPSAWKIGRAFDSRFNFEGFAIHGFVTNSTSKTCGMVVITFNLTDQNGFHVRNAGDSTHDLPPGAAWKFTIPTEFMQQAHLVECYGEFQ